MANPANAPLILSSLAEIMKDVHQEFKYSKDTLPSLMITKLMAVAATNNVHSKSSHSPKAAMQVIERIQAEVCTF